MHQKKLTLTIALSCLACMYSFSQQQVLMMGTNVSKKLLKGEKHVYSISLEKGGLAELSVVQKGVDLAVDVIDPAGKKSGSFDSPNGTEGPEPVSIEGTVKGVYKIEIYPLVEQQQMSEEDKKKWAEENQGSYIIEHVTVLSSKQNKQKIAQEKSDNATIISWLGKNAHPLKAVSAANGFEDLQWMKTDLKDVRYLALGVNTMGTKEFYQLSHRMLEFLVTEMGFTSFVLQTSISGATAINEYVLNGKGDARTALAPMWWYTEEMIAMIEWIRKYNTTASPEKKIKFFGIDPQNNVKTGAIDKLEGWVKKVDPVFYKSNDSLFYRARIFDDDTLDAGTRKNFLTGWLAFVAQLQMRKGHYVQSSSNDEYEQALRQAVSIAQIDDASLMTASDPRKTERDWWNYYLANNFEELIQQEPPGTRFLITGPLYITMKTGTAFTFTPTFGEYMKKNYDQAYYSVVMCFDTGDFIAKEFTTAVKFSQAPIRSFTAGPFKQGWLEWYLSQTGKQNFMVNLRSTPSSRVTDSFLNRPVTFRVFGPSTNEQGLQTSFLQTTLNNDFDGIIFLNSTTAATALKKM